MLRHEETHIQTRKELVDITHFNFNHLRRSAISSNYQKSTRGWFLFSYISMWGTGRDFIFNKKPVYCSAAFWPPRSLQNIPWLHRGYPWGHSTHIACVKRTQNSLVLASRDSLLRIRQLRKNLNFWINIVMMLSIVAVFYGTQAFNRAYADGFQVIRPLT